MGYAWQKGTLEYLEERKAAGEKVEIVYSHGTFAGYGYVTRTLETADDENGYVAGALMTLFDAIPVERSGFEGDEAYNGLKIERNLTNNITRMYIEQGYAGEKVEFVREKDEAGKELEVTFRPVLIKTETPFRQPAEYGLRLRYSGQIQISYIMIWMAWIHIRSGILTASSLPMCMIKRISRRLWKMQNGTAETLKRLI